MGTTPAPCMRTLLLLLCVVSTARAACYSTPPRYSDRHSYSSSSSNAYYQCSAGYVKTSGYSRASCSYNYYWPQPSLRCRLADCPPLQPPDNGHLQPSTTTYHVYDVVTVTCDTGYTLTGNSKIVCLTDKLWTAQPGTCQVITCPRLPPPDNGRLDAPGATGYLVMDVINVTCNQGYTLTGNNSVTCGTDGQWLGEPGICQVAACPPLQPPDNGRLQPSGAAGYHVFDIVNVTCTPGYTLTGNSRLVCLTDRQWTAQPGTCQAITCPALLPPSNSQLVPSCTVGHHVYDNVTVVCHTGCKLSGNSSVMCGQDGQWVGQLGTCQDVDCGVPEVVNGEVLVESGTGYESTITYRCYEDTTTVGEGYLGEYQSFCTGDGTWDPQPPTCKGKAGLNIIVHPKWPYLGPTNMSVTCELVGHELTSDLTLEVAGVRFYNWTLLHHADNTSSYVITGRHLVAPDDAGGEGISCRLTGDKPGYVYKGPILFARSPSGHPHLTIPNKDRVVHPGDDVTLTCQVEDPGVPAASYIWYRNEQVIKKVQQHTYTFTAPGEETSDSFLCKAVNSVGSTELSSPLHVAVVHPWSKFGDALSDSPGARAAVYGPVGIVLVILAGVVIFCAYRKYSKFRTGEVSGRRWPWDKVELKPYEEKDHD